MKSRRNLLLSLLLCCTMTLGISTVTASAATADENPQPFSFEVDKTVVKGGDTVPGEETFTFDLVYGTVGENEQYSVVFTPDDSVTLADCGIAFTNNTITTNGAGEQTFTLGGTIDPTKVDSEHHWQASTGNDGVPKHIITLRLTEKNDGKAGWTYSDVERYLTITVKRTGISAEVGILGNDVYDNNFENIYTAYSFTVKKTDADGNPLVGAVFSLTATDSTVVLNFEATSGADGIATFHVPEGNYTLAEKTAPNGYVKSDETYTLAVRNDVDYTTLDWGGEPGVYVYNEDEPDYSNFKYVKYQQVTFVNTAEPQPEKPADPIESSEPTKPATPETGDNSNLFLLAALLFVSGFGVFGATVYCKKKKESAE
ncbi:MAG: prealbumin-like fold domain-containing protein [Clostridiales bacterium]|nr:prealbumin-like fold domain-containing protein [Clostridiales bacterium]